MKKLNFVLIISLLFTNFALNAQYAYDDQAYDDSFYPGYQGDDFSLEGALEVFKNSRNIEAFEFDINNQDRYVNNLDLNNDGRIDFIRVSDQSESPTVRLVVMQAVLGRGDVQDIAVIAIEKTGRRTATLQIIGDEYLFGPDMIIEPSDIEYRNDRYGRGGPNGNIIGSRFFINVYYWPSVRSLYRNSYRFYRSPYYWGYYPRVWNPWSPFRYSVYYDRCGRYRRGFYRVVPSVRIVYVTNFYRPRRVCSVRVRDRYERYRPYYQNNRGGGRGNRGLDNNNGNRGPRRSYSQTKPERRATYDAKRDVEITKTRDTRISKSNAGARTHKATTSQGNYRPTSEVGTSRSNSSRGYESTKSTTRDTRTSKYNTPTRKAERTKTVTPTRDSYSKKTESYKSSRKSETRSSSKPAPRSSTSSKSSSSSRSSYSKPSRSSSSSASRGATSSSRRSSSASSSSKKSSAAPRTSRSSSRVSAPKTQRKSSSSSSKGRTKSRRGSAN